MLLQEAVLRRLVLLQLWRLWLLVDLCLLLRWLQAKLLGWWCCLRAVTQPRLLLLRLLQLLRLVGPNPTRSRLRAMLLLLCLYLPVALLLLLVRLLRLPYWQLEAPSLMLLRQRVRLLPE